MHYNLEIHAAIKGLVGSGLPFDVTDIKSLVEDLLNDGGKYYDPIKAKDLRNILLIMFERGRMPGYCLISKPVIDESGPKMILEFIPENPLSILDLIDKPKNGERASCNLHSYYKDRLKQICENVDCTQDMLIRSILIKAIDLIVEQLR